MVTVVSRWPASVVAVVLLVSISPRRRVRCAKKFAQHGLIVGLCAKKFALRARNTPNLTFLRLLGEFCRGLSGEGSCRANLVAPGGPPPSPEQSLARHYPGPAGACRPRHHTLRCLGTPTSASAGVLHYTKPSCGVSPACRTPVSCNSPRLVARARDLRGYGRQSADPLGENR